MFWQRRNGTRASRSCKVGQLGLEQLDARVVPAPVAPGSVIATGTAHLSVYFDEYSHAKATYGSKTMTPDYATKDGTLAYKLPVAVKEGYVNVYEHRGSSEVSDVLRFVHTHDKGKDEYWLYVYSDKEKYNEPGNKADSGIPKNYKADSSVYEDAFGNVDYSTGRADYYFYGDSIYTESNE